MNHEKPTLAFRGPSVADDASIAAETIPWFDGALEEDEPEVTKREVPRSAPPAPRPPTPAPRAAAGARIRDEGEIARGGMGAIRRLYDTELRRHIAMKVLEPELATHPTSAQRFLDEARITGLLDHANIVPIHDMGPDERGNASYTMKLVEGQTLTEVIAAQKTLRDLERILQILIKVCDGLSYAHSHNVIHRDLKPDNIMVGSHGQVYVMDWGLAQVIGTDRAIVDGRVEEDGFVIGTLQYMSPEQARGEISRIDPRTDVFALGAILYKALTGSPPYTGSTTDALAAAQRGQVRSPDELTQLSVKPPPGLSEIAMKAMACNPADRYQNAEAFAEAVRAFLRGGNWFPLHKFAAGSVIVREGDPPDAAYILTAGTCEVRKRDPQGRMVTLRTLRAGDVFGETAIFANAPRSATVIAMDEVSAVVVERTAVDHLMRSSWLGMFVKALADRFLELESRVSS
jgi:eukaryotic-like serine/threonine-protein kinase